MVLVFSFQRSHQMKTNTIAESWNRQEHLSHKYSSQPGWEESRKMEDDEGDHNSKHSSPLALSDEVPARHHSTDQEETTVQSHELGVWCRSSNSNFCYLCFTNTDSLASWNLSCNHKMKIISLPLLTTTLSMKTVLEIKCDHTHNQGLYLTNN